MGYYNSVCVSVPARMNLLDYVSVSFSQAGNFILANLSKYLRPRASYTIS
jgi:hypothetical protein